MLSLDSQGQRRSAADAPLHQSLKFEGAWGLSWGYRRGAHESNRGAGVSLLFCTRWFRQGQVRRVCSPPLPLSGRCGAAVVKNGLGHFCYIVILHMPPQPSGRGDATDYSCFFTRWFLVLMLDLRPRADEPPDLIGTVGAGIDGDSAIPSSFFPPFPCSAVHFFAWQHTFCGTSGRSRMDFVATPSTVQYSRVFVDVTAGRRL